MSSALATQAGGALAMSEGELIDVLTTSLYPGASVPSVKMVLGYCKAAGLDPMQKPVHIVPMWDGKARQMRDVVMPGVGLYRTQASRTGTFAGQSEPEFGPMITANLGGVEITYPEYAKVTVRKALANGVIAEFTAVEYWVENYAVKGGAEKSIAPNSMWSKRPRGQIAKCAEAQALRKAFPEIGSAPTAEEMEGKAFVEEHATVDQSTGEIKPKELPPYSAEAFNKNLRAWEALIEDGKKTPDQIIATVSTKGRLSDEQIATLRSIQRIKDDDVTDVEIKQPAQQTETEQAE